MGVNIFGAAGSSRFSHDNDHKFKTLSTNLALKLNKSGDTMTGDFNILLNGDEMRTFGVSDLSTAQSFSFLLGDVDNQIRHNFGFPIKLAASRGTKFTCPAGKICQLGTETNASAMFFNDIIMNDNFLKQLHAPRDDRDAANKLYVDTRCFKNSCGYIPNLITNDRNKVGFIVSASSELGLNLACNVFSIIGEWISEVKTSFWIKIRCPEPVRIHKISLRGVSTGTIRNWILQASNDDDVWENLYDNYLDSGNTSSCIDDSLFILEIDSIEKYFTYRIWINNTDGQRPGLSHWQLYSVDTLV
jgi:hypothetical protein